MCAQSHLDTLPVVSPLACVCVCGHRLLLNCFYLAFFLVYYTQVHICVCVCVCMCVCVCVCVYQCLRYKVYK